MAEIRCTNCGTVNPAGAKVCKSCRADLVAQSGDSGLPDWLSGLSSDDTLPSQPASDLPDWLSRLGSPSPSELSGATPSAEPPSGAPVPDWLSEITPRDKGDATVPDWTEELGITAAKAEEPTQPPATDEPEWLRRVRARQQAEQSQPAEDFFSAEPPPSAGAAAPEEGLPDWLSRMGQSEAPASRQEAFTGAQPFAQFEPSEEPPAPAAGAEGLPDWLAGLGEAASPPPASSSTPAFTPAFTSDADLEDFILDASAESETPPAVSAEPAELPEWVSQLSPDQELPEPARPVESAAEPELPPAQLPSWLEAMRPVESAAPIVSFRDEKDTYVESAGPLAGLRGVLPAEAEVARQRKPPTYSVKLQVSEAQQAHLAMLDALLKSEGQAKPIASAGGIAALPLLRVVIALALALAVFWTLWSDLDMVAMPSPDKTPAEVGDLINWVNALPPQSPVLVAFDYEPALSGEMDAAAKVVIEDMMGRQAHFVTLSTSPLGPMVAEHLFGLIAETQQVTYPHRTNLGYLPGGPSGLFGFAANPRSAIPLGLSGGDDWQTPPLQAVHSIADFAMLLVITDNADTARQWIEQVRPWLGDKPLTMVVSAQAEPLVRPYYHTGPKQVNGLVVSLMGSSAYEARRGLLGLTRAYWDSFSATILVTLFLVLLGGSINLLLAWLAERKQTGAV